MPRFVVPHVSDLIYLLLVVCCSDWVSDSCQLANPWRPYVCRHDVPATDPALSLLPRVNGPLGRPRNQIFVSEMPLNDELH